MTLTTANVQALATRYRPSLWRVLAARGALPAQYGWTQTLGGWLVVLLTMWAYYSTAYPSISGGDAGELVVTTCNLGVAHPPGYPTFTMLGHVWQRWLFPFGHVAWRLNMLSSLEQALAGFCVYRAALLLSGGWVPVGLISAALFNFSMTIWTYSTQGEVFALNNLLCAALGWAVVAFAHSWHRYTLRVRACGLATQLCTLSKTVSEPPVSSPAPDAPSPAPPSKSRRRKPAGRTEHKTAAPCALPLAACADRPHAPVDAQTRLRFESYAADTLACAIACEGPRRVWQRVEAGEPVGSYSVQEACDAVSVARVQTGRVVVLLAFLCGLGHTNQHTTVFFTIPTALAVAVVCMWPVGTSIPPSVRTTLAQHNPEALAKVRATCRADRVISVRVVLGAVLAVAIGMLPYLYMPWAAARFPHDSWGDQRDLSGFLKHFLRQEYGTFQLAAGDTPADGPTFWDRIEVYYQWLWDEFSGMLVLMAAVGVAASSVFQVALPLCGCAAGADQVWTRVPAQDGPDGAPGKPEGTARVVQASRASSDTWVSPAPSGLMDWLVRLHGALARENCVARAVLVASYIFYIFMFHYLANMELERPLLLGVQARFWQQPNLYVCLLAAEGLRLTLFLWTSLLEATLSATTVRRVLRTLVPLVCAVCVCGWQVQRTWSKVDHFDAIGFFDQGKAILESMPRDALVLVNGDLNNNMVKYAQQCEGVRRDVRLVSTQLMTWDWFVGTQAGNYPGVNFPGYVYHPRKPGAFSMLEFLQANEADFPIFRCGPWKHGDDTHAAMYESHAYGLCHRILPRGQQVPDLVDFLKRGSRALLFGAQLPPFVPASHGSETWEWVLHNDAWKTAIHAASVMGYHTNVLLQGRHPQAAELLRWTTAWYDRLLDRRQEPRRSHAHMIRKDEWRAAGILYGQLSRELDKKMVRWRKAVREAEELGLEDAEADQKLAGLRERMWRLERKMHGAWTELLRRDPADREIRPYLEQHVNPYSGRQMDVRIPVWKPPAGLPSLAELRAQQRRAREMADEQAARKRKEQAAKRKKRQQKKKKKKKQKKKNREKDTQE